MKHLLLALLALFHTLVPVQAHEGHGLPGSSHWHASDTLGFVAVMVFAAAVWWLIRRK